MSTLPLVAPLVTIFCAQASAILPSDSAAGLLAATQQQQAAASDLHFSFTPGVWLARVGGDVKLGPSPAADDINLEDDFHLNNLETVFNFEISMTKGQHWQIDASGFDFSTDTRGVFASSGVFGPIAFGPGDAFSSSFDMTSLALDVTYWRWHPIDSAEGGTTDLRFGYGAGVRWFEVKQHLTLTGVPGATAEGRGEWLVPELVLQMNLRHDLPESIPVLDAFEVLVGGTVGPAIGGDSGVVVSLRAGIRGWICPNASVDFGYRLMEASVRNADYKLVGGLQGLFLSGTFRF